MKRSVPVCTAVPSLLPRAPKTVPRMPMAAGTSTSRPGSSSRVELIAPRVKPGDEAGHQPERQRDEALSDTGEIRSEECAETRREQTTGGHGYLGPEGPGPVWTLQGGIGGMTGW